MTQNTQAEINEICAQRVLPRVPKGSPLELGRLLPCPLCGGDEGYNLCEGSTFRWWSIQCGACGHEVTEAHATYPAETTPRTARADTAWNDAGAYASRLRAALEKIATWPHEYDTHLVALRNIARDALTPNAEPPDDYKLWYEEAMAASNEAGYVGYSAADTIRELAKRPAPAAQEPLTPDMFWDANDYDNNGDEIEDVIEAREPGEIVTIERALRLPSITVLVTQDDDGMGYEVVDGITGSAK